MGAYVGYKFIIILLCLYGSCNSDPLKFGTWALTREWALAWDTKVVPGVVVGTKVASCSCRYTHRETLNMHLIWMIRRESALDKVRALWST